MAMEAIIQFLKMGAELGEQLHNRLDNLHRQKETAKAANNFYLITYLEDEIEFLNGLIALIGA